MGYGSLSKGGQFAKRGAKGGLPSGLQTRLITPLGDGHRADEDPRRRAAPRLDDTPVVVEVTDPDKVARMRAPFPDDPDTDDASPMAGTARRLGDGCDRLHGPGPSH